MTGFLKENENACSEGQAQEQAKQKLAFDEIVKLLKEAEFTYWDAKSLLQSIDYFFQKNSRL